MPETCNLGTLRGGTATNTVADHAEAYLDHRTVGDGREILSWWQRGPRRATCP